MNTSAPSCARLGPERIVLRKREILAVDVPADRHAFQTKTVHAVFELFAGEVRMLQRHRRHRHETIGVGSHPLREALVLGQHNAAGQVAIGRVPPVAVDAERLDVEPLPIHLLDALRAEDVVAAPAAVLLERRALHDLDDRDDAVAMDVDHPDASAVQRRLPSSARLRERRQRTADSSHRRRACGRPDEISSARHVVLLS
jgi:hypothetical protein